MVSGEAFVGRVRELHHLHVLLDRARAGRGQAVLLAGEPGIGKTRLASELADHAEKVAVRVGSGRASEDDGCPPYWVFRQLFTSLDRSLPDALTGTAGGGGQERFEAFEGVARQLRAAADPAGLLVLLDDLQWADSASLALFTHLGRGIGSSRVMIVAAYRDTETIGREARAATMSAVAGEACLTRIRLVGLMPAEVQRQLAAVTDGQVSEERAALVSLPTLSMCTSSRIPPMPSLRCVHLGDERRPTAVHPFDEGGLPHRAHGVGARRADLPCGSSRSKLADADDDHDQLCQHRNAFTPHQMGRSPFRSGAEMAGL